MKTDCDVIRDLLPLYEDEVCSEKSRDLVREHLEECSVCLELFNQLHDTEIENELKEEKISVIEYGTRRFRRRLMMIGFLISTFFAILILNPLIKDFTTEVICSFKDHHAKSAKRLEKHLKRAAMWGDPDGEYEYGKILLAKTFSTEDGKSDRLKADGITLLQAAADHGHPRAEADLGSYYLRGFYVKKDTTRAFTLFQRAAEHGDLSALYLLGICYLHGRGVEQDKAEAVKWFKKAVDREATPAFYLLGNCYYHGEGVNQDFTQAVDLFRKAAEKHYGDAELALGRCYFNGEGVEQNKQTATELYRKSAEHQNSKAQFVLAQSYFDGEGVEQNSDEAVYWLLSSAENGLLEGQFDYAKRLAEGNGVEKNLQEAVIWFRKAAEQGNEEAKEALKELEGENREE